MKFIINGREQQVQPEPGISLLTLLREQLGMTGTKYGCGEGECGACTVLIDGSAKRSCRIDAVDAAGRQITTIEGLGTPENLHPVQSAFIKHQAFQCGFCTTGMIMSTAALLKKKTTPSDTDIISALNGNICRCGTHPRVIAAVREAATELSKAGAK